MIFLGIFIGASLTILTLEILAYVYISRHPKYKKVEIERKIAQKKAENEIFEDIKKLQNTLGELANTNGMLRSEVKDNERDIKHLLED
jgi:hypothetical protein